MAKAKHMTGEYRAIHRDARMSQRKVKLIVDLIRGRDVDEARLALRFSRKRAAYLVDRVLKSAIHNADQTGDVDVDRLYICGATVDRASAYRRWRPGAHGRTKPYQRRNCHIRVVVKERPGEA